MNRKAFLLTGISIGVILIGGASFLMYWHNRSSAVIVPPPPASPVFSLYIEQDGAPASGMVSLTGDCPNRALGTQTGYITCTLTPETVIGNTTPVGKITTVTFSDYNDTLSYSVPLNKNSGEPDGISIPSGGTEYFKLTIVRGQATFYHSENNQMVQVYP